MKDRDEIEEFRKMCESHRKFYEFEYLTAEDKGIAAYNIQMLQTIIDTLNWVLEEEV